MATRLTNDPPLLRRDPSVKNEALRLLSGHQNLHDPSTPIKYIVFDTETTTDHATRRMLQFGSIEVAPTTLETVEGGEFETIIGGADVAQLVTPLSVKINHITPEQCERAPVFRDVADSIFKIMDRAIWIGYNIITFDIPMLQKEFLLCGKQAPVPIAVVDVLLWFRALGKSGRMPLLIPDFRLATVAQACGLGDETHTALSDAIMCRDAFQIIGLGYPIRTPTPPQSPPPPSSPPPLMRSPSTLIQSSAYDQQSYMKEVLINHLKNAEKGLIVIMKFKHVSPMGPTHSIVTLGRLLADGDTFIATEHEINKAVSPPVGSVKQTYIMRQFSIKCILEIDAILF